MEDGQYIWNLYGEMRLDLSVYLIKQRKLEVRVSWNAIPNAPPQVNLFASLQHFDVRITDLTGNAFGTAHHLIGLGTFVVNVTIQILKCLYAPYTRVHGMLSDPNDYRWSTDKQSELTHARRAFWRRFGFEIRCADSTSRYDSMSAMLRDLEPVRSGNIDGCVPRFVDIKALRFVSSVQR